jgi:hypothetical protein
MMHMSDSLQKLFGIPARVKLLRLFLFNPKQSFTLEDIAERARIQGKEARRELELFSKIKIIKRARKIARSPAPRFVLNGEFEYVQALQALLLNAPAQGDTILERIRHVGNLKLLILSGIFVGEWEGSLDLLVVGDRINERKLRERVHRLESEIGKELRYAQLTTQDFFYRLNMNDHLLRDVLDYPHRIVLDRLNIGLK